MATIAPHIEAADDDVEAITAAARNYLEGYLSGDADRHGRAYHPEAVKRRYSEDEDGVFGIISISPRTMADSAGVHEPEDTGDYDIFIDDISQDMASVRVYSKYWVDFLHVVKARGEWRLFHVTWHRRS